MTKLEKILADPQYRFEERVKRLMNSKGFTEEEAKECVIESIVKGELKQ